jgi:hypothetical protein
MLLESKLRVVVMDENSSRQHAMLGAGSISLRRLGPRINSEVELTVDLHDNGVAQGQAIIGATLRLAQAEEITETIAEDQISLQRGLLMIKSVEAKDMKGGDGGPFDKQAEFPLPPPSPLSSSHFSLCRTSMSPSSSEIGSGGPLSRTTQAPPPLGTV